MLFRQSNLRIIRTQFPRFSKSKKSKNNKAYSTLSQHKPNNKTKGKILNPPLLASGLPITPTSWMNDRLPEFIWAALLILRLGRQDALTVFRRFFKYVELNLTKAPFSGSFSDIDSLNNSDKKRLIDFLCSDEFVKKALEPIVVMRELPSWDVWQQYLAVEPLSEHWDEIAFAVATVLNHKSQEATDCRWLKVMSLIASGHIKFLPETREVLYMFWEYPLIYDQREVCSKIRSYEMTVQNPMWKTTMASDWPRRFWGECLAKTPCKPWNHIDIPIITDATTTISHVNMVYNEVIGHCNSCRTTTAMDARHDTSFGLVLYSLSLLKELLSIGVSVKISGRMLLRTLMELFIKFEYLVKKDQSDIWKADRSYGAGQAKLVFLKLQEYIDQPGYVDQATLEELANEDVWQEFQPINIGSWSGMDLRKMSEETGLKDVYDKFYPWTSGFVHSNWGAIRDTTFQLCANPLHRLHRIPRDSARSLPDVISDACGLVDRILEVLDRAYPNFKTRITII